MALDPSGWDARRSATTGPVSPPSASSVADVHLGDYATTTEIIQEASSPATMAIGLEVVVGSIEALSCALFSYYVSSLFRRAPLNMVGIYSEQVPVDDVHDALKYLYSRDSMISIVAFTSLALATWHLRRRFSSFLSTRVDAETAKQATVEAEKDDEGGSSKDEEAGTDVETTCGATTSSPQQASEDAGTEPRGRVGRGHQAALERIITRKNLKIKELRKKIKKAKQQLHSANKKLSEAEGVGKTEAQAQASGKRRRRHPEGRHVDGRARSEDG
ncbi:uncharacterized protein N0V89_011805 [Didymosphaeria variabile]|uniref:Uncharacterized protein n=1 Tax=Didymosphaeria variabile TaxID=1932322 RepID=A0A9W8XBU9_9PLEO|nr:uncharacterized protein N0V89_011805 [Didymosphaeria variabile]KAJ4345670.1 hypothetical protein N0V89_011805 [Didymosphaeria variabile]